MSNRVKSRGGLLSRSGGLLIPGGGLLPSAGATAGVSFGINGNGTFESAYATNQWTLQSTSGLYPDSGSGTAETLANSGGTQGQTALGLPGRLAWESDSTAANTDSIRASGTVAGNSNLEDLSGRIVLRVTESLGSNNSLLGDYTGGGGAANAGWMVQIVGGAIQLQLYDGTLIDTANIGLTGLGSDWISIDFWYDYSAQIAYMKTTSESEVSSSTAGLGTMTNSENLYVNTRSGSLGQAGLSVVYAGVAVGSDAQNLYNETVTFP